MDFSNAAILIAAVFGAVELLKALVPQVSLSSRLTVLSVLVLSVGATFLLGATVWAHQQVIGGHALDTLGVADKFVVGLFLAGTAAATDKAVHMVRNIGQNEVQKPVAK
jgi:hypothetical protein